MIRPDALLAPLREELDLDTGPVDADGAPSWTISDPATGRMYRIGWVEFEMLRRWHRGTPASVAAAVQAETTLDIGAEEVLELAGFLAHNHLLQARGEKATAVFLKAKAASKEHPLKALLHKYLFFRIPVARPDAFYGRLLPWVGWVMTPGFVLVTVLAGLTGLFLVVRQWEAFLASFPFFLSAQGIIGAASSYALLKVLHELGHGLVAKRFGLRLKSVGIAVMVFYPMFYTDTTEAWRLPDRRRRMWIGAAGMATELLVACWALLVWNFLPDGPLRSVVFVWATSAWVLTLLVNASPFMRFDGYYLFADWLNVPNLQPQAFGLARWRLRRWILGDQAPCPMELTRRREWVLTGYAYFTWLYRLTLFLGIAVVVYQAAFKVLGIVLAGIEVVWFILRPLVAELRTWPKLPKARLRRRNIMISAGVVVVALVLVLVPLRHRISAPGLMGAEQRSYFYAPAAAMVAALPAPPGSQLAEGAPVVELRSPELEFRLEQARLRVATLRWQAENVGQQRDMVARSKLFELELETAEADLLALRAEFQSLTVRAPLAGRVHEVQEGMRPGDWVPRGEPLGYMLDATRTVVDGYIAEEDLLRVQVGDTAWFVPRNPDLRRVRLRIAQIGEAALAELPEPEVTELGQEALPARKSQEEKYVPVSATYRVRLVPEEPVALGPGRLEPGHVLIAAAPESFVRMVWRRFVGVLVRESGF